MLDQLFGAHVRNLQSSMDRAGERHGMLSNNLANLNTPGYKRQDIEFGIALEKAQSGFTLKRLGQDPRSSGGSQRLDGNSVNLEQEIVALAETEQRYKLLTEMTNRYFSGLKNVIREGR